jgi:hypothetical protein
VVTSNDAQSTRWPGWRREPELPASLEELQGPLTGEVGLPLRIFWSGGEPGARRWDLGDVDARRSLYEIVLQEGTLEDVRRLINGAELVRIWDRLFLPAWISAAWSPLIASDTSAA